MTPVLGHGPWWTELHHFPEVLIWVPAGMAALYAFLLGLRRKRGDNPSNYLFSSKCAACGHGAGNHRWILAKAGSEIRMNYNRTNCHKCSCIGYIADASARRYDTDEL